VSRRLVRLIGGGLLATLITLSALEALIRVTYAVRNAFVIEVALPYVVGDEAGPMAPWIDALRILEPDPDLLWRGKANVRRRYLDVFGPARTEHERTALLRRFRPGLPAAYAGGATWEVELNSAGFRDDERPAAKAPSTFRVLCLGDSWTFGANVNRQQTYPYRLGVRLREAYPDAQIEVWNLGVMGYSSYQGLELLRRRAHELHPDLVVIGYAMNDGRVPGWRDRDMSSYRVSQWLSRLELFKLLHYFTLLTKYRPTSLSERLHAKAAQPAAAADYMTMQEWTRVAPTDYEANITAMIELARSRGAGVILVYNELWQDGPYRDVLARVARARTVPLVDSSALVAAARAQAEAALEGELGLRPATRQSRPGGDVDVVFRVSVGGHPVPQAMYIVGTDPALGATVPNRVRMYDDGTHGDQRAGDGVWSLTVRVRPGARLFYMYTNSGREGVWEGLDVPEIRTTTVNPTAAGGPAYHPIEIFGAIPMHADSWHTNAAGYDLIAGAVADTIVRDGRLRRPN